MKVLSVLVVGLAMVFFATSALAHGKPEAPKAEAVKKEAPLPAPAAAPVKEVKKEAPKAEAVKKEAPLPAPAAPPAKEAKKEAPPAKK